jgi:hypothetical protein
MSLSQPATFSVGPPTPATGGRGHPLGAHRHGHAHFWRRALSRRHFVRTAAALAALGLATSHPASRSALAQATDGAMPKPIPGGIQPPFADELIHHYLPAPGSEPSQITDFRGFVSIAHVQGEGTVTTGGGGGGLSTPTATGDRLVFDADMRFMQGLYVGEDAQEHTGTFAFI